MDTFYLLLVVFLFVLAVFDLIVGVSNDAVNFLNSAIGAKAASFKVVMIVAALGIFVGATFSNGMMEIARHGIYQPNYFYFSEVMCILVAVMLTDVILLDIFNSLGMPTSTTVSLVFELLGGTFALALIKIARSEEALTFGNLLNTDKALSVILAIFVSVAIAFFFGALVQYVSRLLFTFNYKNHLKYSVALFGGVAITAIVYFMLIKGLKESTFMSGGHKEWIQAHTPAIVGYGFVVSTVLMQILHWLGVNVFRVIVLVGTFALALAFAGNDLVNFIGVPLAGYSSYLDFAAQGDGVTPDRYLMGALLEPARTPWYFLVGSGIVMVIALFRSEKAHNVVKTSLDLARQEEGEENFGTSPIARALVRAFTTTSTAILNFTPVRVKRWIGSRFAQDSVILENGAAFDLVRGSVNVVLAGLLIALGTSLKLPLSTTYVAFMVAMGSSLADRAWGRESAVYRLTGVMSVIGGWFITAGAAFTICFIMALIIYYGGMAAIFALSVLAVFVLIRSQVMYKRKKSERKGDPTVEKLMESRNEEAALSLLRQHTREEWSSVLEVAGRNFEKIVGSFISENLRGLRKACASVEEEKGRLKRIRRIGALGMRRLDRQRAMDKGLYYYQGNDFAGEIIYSIGRLCEPCLEHVDNHFNPLEGKQEAEMQLVGGKVNDFLSSVRMAILQNDYTGFSEMADSGNRLSAELAQVKRNELKRLQGRTGSIKVNMVYLAMIQETQHVVSYAINLLKVSRKFQQD